MSVRVHVCVCVCAREWVGNTESQGLLCKRASQINGPFATKNCDLRGPTHICKLIYTHIQIHESIKILQTLPHYSEVFLLAFYVNTFTSGPLKKSSSTRKQWRGGGGNTLLQTILLDFFSSRRFPEWFFCRAAPISRKNPHLRLQLPLWKQYQKLKQHTIVGLLLRGKAQ